MFACLLLIFISNLGCSHAYRATVSNYPKDTQFWATDFFVRGCKNFVDNCPSTYKYQHICAQNYNGDFKDFPNYCEMQYENCNTWRSKTPLFINTRLEYREKL